MVADSIVFSNDSEVSTEDAVQDTVPLAFSQAMQCFIQGEKNCMRVPQIAVVMANTLRSYSPSTWKRGTSHLSTYCK